nr:mutS protein homolog 4-like [Diachasma alloeum]
MNVVGQENTLGNPRARDRARNRGKIGKITKDKVPIALVPKYRIPELLKSLVNMGSTSTPRTPTAARGARRENTPSSSAKRGIPRFSTTDATSSPSACTEEHFVILAITSGRGLARGEVGMAAIDLQYPHIILSQMSDDNSYANALTKIHMFQPVEILIPDTMGKDQKDPNSLYTAIKTHFPTVEITEISRIHWKAVTGLERIQTHCTNEFSSIELIVKPKYYALSAVCTLFKYIESIQHVVYTQNSVRFEYQAAQNAMMIDLESAQNLELVTSYGNKYNFCLLGALDRCSTPAGRRLLRASILQPSCDLSAIQKRQDCVSELVSNKSLYAIIHPAIRRLYGVHRLLNFATQHPHADTIERAERSLNYALLLKHTLSVIPELKAALKTAVSPFFKQVADHLMNKDFEFMREKISEFIHPEAQSVKGYTSSNYNRCFAIKVGISDSLDVARRAYCELIDDMEKMVEDIGKRHNLGLTFANSSTLGYHIEMKLPRNYKFELERLPQELIEAHIKGGTVYMTTQELFVKNQHCKDACVEIHLMSNTVMGHMFEAIKGRMGCLFQFNDDVAEMDVILSLATISSISDYVRPTFGASLEVRDGKHPVMDILGTESPTPNDTVASTAYNFHTITGPNMGGKTIYLKQIVLLHIMAQIGCFVPATKAQFRITDHIFCRLGARDDIEFNASTFMLEIKEAQYILQSLTPNSLVILDELCRSTTVEEGASIAWAISKKLLLSKAFTFSATHFEYLLKLADLYPNATNHHFEAIPNGIDRPEEARLVYTHKVKRGVQKIQNYGLVLARATGLPEDVLADAHRFAQEIRGSMELNQPQTPPAAPQSPGESKLQRNYDKLAGVYNKLENNYEVSDDELYALVRGLEAISYGELPPETPKPLSQHKTSEKSSGLYSAGPKSSTTSNASTRSQESLRTSSSKQTSALKLAPESSKKTTKRQVTFSENSVALSPEAKLPKLEETSRPSPSTSGRQPLRTMNPPPAPGNSPFKVPQKCFLKKCLTEDPESPFFIPRSQQGIKTGLLSSSSSFSSCGSFIKSSKEDSKEDSLSKLQSLTTKHGSIVKRKRSQKDMIPKSFHHFFPSMRQLSSQQFSSTKEVCSLPVPGSSQQYDPAVIASLPKFLRPVGENTFFPPEYSHLRHMAKNIYDEEENEGSPGGSHQYYFMSKTVKKTPASSTNDSSEARETVKSPSFVNYPKGVASGLEKGLSIDRVIPGVSGMGSVVLDPMDPSSIIVLSSESEGEEEVVSQCSMNSVEARNSAREKEAAIFRKIEGREFDEGKFFKDLENSLK